MLNAPKPKQQQEMKNIKPTYMGFHIPKCMANFEAFTSWNILSSMNSLFLKNSKYRKHLFWP